LPPRHRHRQTPNCTQEGLWTEAYLVARDLVGLVLGNLIFSTAHTWLFIHFADSSVIKLRVRALGSLISSSDGDHAGELLVNPGSPVARSHTASKPSCEDGNRASALGSNETATQTATQDVCGNVAVGQGIHMLSNDAERLRRIVAHELPTAIERVFAVVVCLVLMYQLSPSLTGVTVVLAGKDVCPIYV
jgi:ABC-type multidrug transport system fused ATPase/permease subunit